MRRRAGFTLLELLAASALTAVLMLVLFQVIGSLGRTRAALAREVVVQPSRLQSQAGALHHNAPWKLDLIETLRWDLTNATARQSQPNRLTLTGHGSLDRRTLATGHEPVTVVYEVNSRGSRPCLVRWEVPRRVQSSDSGWSQLVCADVSRFAVEPVNAGRATNAKMLRIRIESPGGPVIEELIVLD